VSRTFPTGSADSGALGLGSRRYASLAMPLLSRHKRVELASERCDDCGIIRLPVQCLQLDHSSRTRRKGRGLSLDRSQSFASAVPGSYLALHPFKRVPTLVHDDFQIYETGAITRYVDEAFPGPNLQPTDPRHRARSSQFISIVDSYVYCPLVRQVFSHRVFRPLLGRPTDISEVQRGLETAPVVLAALERLVADTAFLCGNGISLGDIHLAPMIGYFAMAEEGDALLKTQRKLCNWWSTMSARTAYRATKPRLPYNLHYCGRSQPLGMAGALAIAGR